MDVVGEISRYSCADMDRGGGNLTCLPNIMRCDSCETGVMSVVAVVDRFDSSHSDLASRIGIGW